MALTVEGAVDFRDEKCMAIYPCRIELNLTSSYAQKNKSAKVKAEVAKLQSQAQMAGKSKAQLDKEKEKWVVIYLTSFIATNIIRVLGLSVRRKNWRRRSVRRKKLPYYDRCRHKRYHLEWTRKLCYVHFTKRGIAKRGTSVSSVMI